jgi:hypothetical protein
MTSKIGTILIASATVAMAYQAPAEADIHAEGQFRMLLRNGDNAGRTNRDADGRENALDQAMAGFEQSDMVQLSDNSLLIFGMASYELNGQPAQNRMQMLCASVTMDPIAGPQMQSMQYITANNGQDRRNANHARVRTLFNGDVAYLVYNIGNNNNNEAETHAAIIGPGCQVLEPQTLIMAKDNDDCSETNQQDPNVVAEETATTARLYSFEGCNGNGRDDAWINEVVVTRSGPTSFSIDKIQDFSIEVNEECICGMMFVMFDFMLVVVCWIVGNM